MYKSILAAAITFLSVATGAVTANADGTHFPCDQVPTITDGWIAPPECSNLWTRTFDDDFSAKAIDWSKWSSNYNYPVADASSKVGRLQPGRNPLFENFAFPETGVSMLMTDVWPPPSKPWGRTTVASSR